MLGKIEVRRRRGWQRKRWLDGITDSMDMSLSIRSTSRIWWWIKRPGMLQSMGSQRVGQDWATHLNWMLMHGLPRWHNGKESPCQCRRHKWCGFHLWIWKISWRRKWQLTPVFFPGKFHGQRSLVSYSPWGHKESDMTEWLRTHTC